MTKTPYEIYFEERNKKHPWYPEYNRLAEAWSAKCQAMLAEGKDPHSLFLPDPRAPIADVLDYVHAMMNQPDILAIYQSYVERLKLDPDADLIGDETGIVGNFESLFRMKLGKAHNMMPYIYASGVVLAYLQGEIDSLDGPEARKILMIGGNVDE
jgi:hypothetical protein